jgi:hypothetical protein
MKRPPDSKSITDCTIARLASGKQRGIHFFGAFNKRIAGKTAVFFKLSLETEGGRWYDNQK